MVAKSPEQLTSTELLDKAKKALTPEQYGRMESKALDKIGIMELSSMSLDKLKSELPKLAKDDPEEQDILSRLEVEFPGIKSVEKKPETSEKPKVSEKPKFTEHPWDYTKQKMGEAGDWIYEKLPGKDWKDANEKRKEGASGKVVAATFIAGKSAGESLETAEKAMNWFDKLRNDPGKFFKELWEVITSGSWDKIKAFFSSTIGSIGISSATIEKFAEKWLPSDLIKGAKSLFSIEGFSKMNYGDVEKIWKEYQKDPEINIAKKLGIPSDKIKETQGVLEQMFGKGSKDLVEKFVENGGNKSDIGDISMADVIKKVVG